MKNTLGGAVLYLASFSHRKQFNTKRNYLMPVLKSEGILTQKHKIEQTKHMHILNI